MRIENENLLDWFRNAPKCEWCRKPTPAGCDPHHVRSRGAGRIDVRENLVSLCRVCHTIHHAGCEPTTEDLLEVVAKREGRTVESIRRKIDRLRNDDRVKVWVVK
jgi:hypothetical protein